MSKNIIPRNDDQNRAILDHYVSYMLANPFYFKDISGKEATEENVRIEFSILKANGLVAAAHVPTRCAPTCKYCHGQEPKGEW